MTMHLENKYYLDYCTNCKRPFWINKVNKDMLRFEGYHGVKLHLNNKCH